MRDLLYVLLIVGVVVGGCQFTPSPPSVAPVGEVEMIAACEDFKMYRVTGKNTIVPQFVVVGKDGKVAVR